MRDDAHDVGELVKRIESEYREMPGLALTLEQAQRLFGIDAACCGLILAVLIEAGFLARTRAGHYVRTHGRH